MTPKQERFCEEYMIDLNATQAAIRAGYPAKTANKQGPRLLVNVGISKRIAELKGETSERVQITVGELIDDLKEIRSRCMQRIPVMEYDRDSRSMVQAEDDEGRGIWAFDAKGAISAIELIGKHLGAWERKQSGDTHNWPAIAQQFATAIRENS